MEYQRMPWWIAVLSGGYVLYLGLMAWCGFLGPESPGLIASFEGGGLKVVAVEPDSSAARAGILPGDRLLLPGSGAVRSRFDWMAQVANWRHGQSVAIQISRQGSVLPAVLEIRRRDWSQASSASLLAGLVLWGTRVLTLAAALFILLRGRVFVIARLGAWFLASCSVASVVLLPGMAVVAVLLPLSYLYFKRAAAYFADVI